MVSDVDIVTMQYPFDLDCLGHDPDEVLDAVKRALPAAYVFACDAARPGDIVGWPSAARRTALGVEIIVMLMPKGDELIRSLGPEYWSLSPRGTLNPLAIKDFILDRTRGRAVSIEATHD